MRISCCDDYDVGIAALNAPIMLQFARTGIDTYQGKPFKFCPWCGQGIDELPVGESVPSLKEMQQLLNPNIPIKGSASALPS